MALFNRKNSTTNKLPELEWYNNDEQNGRRLRTWVVAVLSLLLASLLAFGLFFGGRWAYRQITKDDAPSSMQSENNTEQTQSTPTEGKNEDLESINTKPTHVDANATAANQDLANTGPSGIVYVFAVTSVLGTVFYRVRLRAKQVR